MAIKKNQLLISLDQLRDEIRSDEQLRTGKIPEICSDEVLGEIANKQPLKISDFLAISGVNKTFMNKYASYFLQAILQYKNKSIREVTVSKDAYKVLDHYKDRLTNISKRNPNLYMGKIIKQRTFDLTQLDLGDELVRFLTNTRLSTLKINPELTKIDDNVIDNITKLYRELNKTEKETGSYDLYIGYPFAEGVITRENFVIKAPLLYFPVTLTRTKREFTIKKDKAKDIQYNRDLLLAVAKIEKSSFDAKTIFQEDFNTKNFENIVIPFYKQHGLKIKENTIKFDFEAYKSELRSSFIKKIKNIISIKEYITLGRYKLYSSMIQKDMDQILASNKYNDLLEGLIDEAGLYLDDYNVNFDFENKNVKESKLTYISELNHSQEKVIDMVNEEQKLVIWGPPGTGKSQTITNLIANSVLKGDNVLVISEKKVALEVIYSRLKKAAKYAMFIDDAENKQIFYQKLREFVNPIPPQRTLNNDKYSLEEKINETLSIMDNALALLYKEKFQGVPIFKLYERYVKDKDIVDNLIPKDVYNMFRRNLKELDFNELNTIEESFSNKKHLQEYLDYHNIQKLYPVVNLLDTKISRSNKIILENFKTEYDGFIRKYKRSFFFRKRRLRKRFLQRHKNTLMFLTVKKKVNIDFFKTILVNRELLDYLIGNLSGINRIASKYEKLSNNQLVFLDMLTNDNLLNNIDDVTQYRKYLFDAFYTGYLEMFYAKNQKYLFIFDKYTEKLEELNGLIEQKQNVTIESFEMTLYQHALNFSNTKRIMDIKRVLEGQRRMSIKAFIDIFQLELMNNIRVWMLTPEVVSAIIPLVYGMFDLVIFDEASQMYVEKGIPAIYRAKKVVIAGDTKQLRPSSLGIGRLDNEDEFYEDDTLRDVATDAKSLLDLARYKYKETILNYHYRSQYEELIAFSNHAFYEGKLIISPNQKLSEKTPIEYIHVKDGIFENRKNLAEAEAVIKLLRKILSTRKDNESIGVITFNSTQRDLIENLIDEQLFKRSKYQKLFEKELFRKENEEDKSLFVKNIENVQGDERDIIIFSMAYARDINGIVKRQFGWLNNDGGQNRLNVAISRAKKKIYFISSLYPEEFKVDDLKSIGPKLLKDYMRYCYYVSHKKNDLARDVLNQLFAKQNLEDHENSKNTLVDDIRQRLEKNNYVVHTSIGIGVYSISLAIYDESSNSYRLGIICDIDEDSDMDARKDLLHQERYLKARNWQVYRVFSTNWYKDSNKEMKNIRDLLK